MPFSWKNKAIFIKTFGCKVNQIESHTIEEALKRSGYKLVADDTEADIVIVNSCIVTHRATRKLRTYINNITKDKEVYLTGCGLFLANHKELNFKREVIYIKKEEILKAITKEKALKDVVWDIYPYTGERGRGFIKISDGCNKACNYCIVRYARGRERYRSISSIINIAKRYEELGFREIVLSGINIAHYRDNNASLKELILQLLKHTNLYIRLSSLEWERLSFSFLDIFYEKRIMRHIHFPLQSASPKVLKDMNRFSNVSKLSRLIEKIYAIDEDIAIGMDIIVGYPTEEKKDFEATIKFLLSHNIAYVHYFTFSPRPYTKAFALKPIYSPKELKTRISQIKEIDLKIRTDFRKRFFGKSRLSIITDGMEAITDNYIPIMLENKEDNQKKQDVLVYLNGFLTNSLTVKGKVITTL
jgi:threonylcarbamoyladenosine tRNA methylthiotransferase MtaB